MANLSAGDWSIQWWKKQHEDGYFPKRPEHLNWKVFDFLPEWLVSNVKLN